MDETDINDTNQCSMVGFLGIMIQLALGILSFSVLILKRLRENPRRPWKIWLFDTSKQLVSQMLAHFINLTISIALTYSDSTSDQCLWYFMTNVLDNTIGVFICILTLKGIQTNLKYRKKYEYVSGNYYTKEKIKVEIEIMDLVNGEIKDSIEVKENQEMQGTNSSQKGNKQDEHDEETVNRDCLKGSRVSTLDSHRPAKEIQILDKYQIDYKSWLVQLLIWIGIVVIGKLIIFGFQISLEQPLKDFSFFILGWIEAYPVLELVLVIVIVPVILNGLAFWVQDNVLKKKQEPIAEGENPLIEQVTERREDQL